MWPGENDKDSKIEYIKHWKYLEKQPPEVFYEKCVLKNLAKFTGKHQSESLFLIKLQAEVRSFI